MAAPGMRVRPKEMHRWTKKGQKKKKKVCFEINLQEQESGGGESFYFSLWSCIISVSSTDTAAPVTEGDNITPDWNKNRRMPICAAKPVGSSDGMA